MKQCVKLWRLLHCVSVVLSLRCYGQKQIELRYLEFEPFHIKEEVKPEAFQRWNYSPFSVFFPPLIFIGERYLESSFALWKVWIKYGVGTSVSAVPNLCSLPWFMWATAACLSLVSLRFYQSIFSTLRKQLLSPDSLFVRLSLYIWIQFLKQQCGMKPTIVLSDVPVSFVCTLVC